MAFYKIVTFLSVVSMVAAQYKQQESYGHGHAESYASVNQLSSGGDSHEYKHHEPVVQYIKHEAQPLYVKHEAPVYKHEYKHEEEHHSHPKYQFKYGVKDSHTHDIKSQEEERDGDDVKGSYSLLQPDGRKRIVHYTASKHGGFNAVVEYSGHAVHPEYKKVEHSAY